MPLKSISTCIVLALQAFTVLAVPTVNNNVAEVMVSTPGGLRPQSKIFHVPDGASLHHTSDAVQIISQTGETLHTNILEKNSGVVHPPFVGEVIGPSRTAAAARALETGYVAYTYFTNNSDSNPIVSFTTSWTVPPVPKTNHDQLLYLFSALTPASNDAILQPVLQYGTSGAGGGNYWATASWYLVGSSTYHSTLVPVQPGQVVGGNLAMKAGVIPSTAGAASSFTYTSNFTHSPYASISATTTEMLNWAWAAFEIYSATTTSDLPTGKTSFTNITMNNFDGKFTPLNWLTRSDPTDGLSAQVMANGSPKGQVDIVF
jgi:hypothetical protein